MLDDVRRRRAPRSSKGATVTLTIAKEPKQVAVPDVLGDDVNDAVDALEEAGFRVRQREETVDTPDEDDDRRAQDEPAGGPEARQGLAGDASPSGASSPRTSIPTRTPRTTPSPTP